MGLNIVEKILKAHLMEDSQWTDNEIHVAVDCVLTNDSAGTMAYLQFEAMNLPQVKTQLAVQYIDHQTLQEGFENADDHVYLQSVANHKGAKFSKAGNGIAHQVHLERFGRPGWIMLGTDSHTPTNGGLGQLSIGVGGLDAAVALGGGGFYLALPRVIRINLSGKLQPWCTAKDVALEVLHLLGIRGNVGSIIEYGGEGVKSLSVTERATIANMGTETGVTSSVFPSDEETYQFLKSQQREECWQSLEADLDASYSRVIEIDLSQVEPNVALPHSPGNVVKLKSVDKIPVDQVLIGSCTNSSYHDLMVVAQILEGRKAHSKVSFGIAPGTRQILQMLTKNRGLEKILHSGARLLESSCGFCVGAGQSPKSGAVSVRTSNRNFKGRSGTEDAEIFLVSPETAAIAAITGYLQDPRETGFEYPEVEMPEKFEIDDGMIIESSGEGEIIRGPNIGKPLEQKPIEKSVVGKVAIKVGDNITTDHILPAGSLMKYRSNIAKYSEYVFAYTDENFHDRCIRNQKEGKLSFIVAGDSYGQGSSREHAAICPMYLGVQVVLAKTIERIHWANLVNFGILPIFFEEQTDYEKIDEEDEVVISDIFELVQSGKGIVNNCTKKLDILVRCDITKRQKEILLAGGLLNYIKSMN